MFCLVLLIKVGGIVQGLGYILENNGPVLQGNLNTIWSVPSTFSKVIFSFKQKSKDAIKIRWRTGEFQIVVSCIWILETGPGPLQEQQTLLISEPFLQPHVSLIFL